MKDKEIIEEMAEIISDTEFVDLDGDTFRVCEFLDESSIEDIARELLKHYQPKLPKDSVVLSKEEYEKQKTLIHELREEIMLNGASSLNYKKAYMELNGYGKKDEIRKETAEKILNELVGHTFEDDGWTWTVSKEDIQWLAEKYEVEIKE